MDNRKDLPIAVIDSGVGGISVLRELIRVMPGERFLYFGDSENAPYGSRSRDEVLAITRRNLSFLREKGIKALVIACNTATSAAVKTLREENPDLPIIGIEPAVKPAALLGEHPRVLVMATPLTLREKKFLSLVARYQDRAEFIPLPCPRLAKLIESGNTEGPEIKEYLAALLAPYQDQRIDAVVLGCTHYPHVKAEIAAHFPADTVILDGGEGTARETRRRVAELGLLREGDEGCVEILNSSSDEAMIEISKKLLYK
ncbi:MAG: glutamate racemase [Clostridia bacterium]|nr:glutamate racemase [Clostridia bacterium]